MEVREVDMGGVGRVFEFTPTSDRLRYDLMLCLSSASRRITAKLRERHDFDSKYQLVAQVRLEKLTYDEAGNYSRREIEPHFLSAIQPYNSVTLGSDVGDAIQQISLSFESYLSEGSGWVMHSVRRVFLKVYMSQPFSAV